MADKTPSSPDGLELRGSPLASARLSRKAALVAVVALAVVLGVIIMNVSKEPPKKAAAEDAPQKQLQPALNAAQKLTRNVPELDEPEDVPPPRRRAPEPPPELPATTATAAPVKSADDDARLADTVIAGFGTDKVTTEARPAADSSPLEAAARTVRGRSGDSSSRLASRLGDLTDAEFDEETDLNGQERKLAFQRQRQDTATLHSKLRPPKSPFELKTGTVIPGILISEMNSDLPGEIIAQVSQNVYDTASGNHLLIPQGTKIFGRYDSSVSFGQERLLVNWHRLIYPDASTLELEGMAGHDQEGKAGFGDRVNNHYGRLFGFGLLTSTLSAAYQLSQSRDEGRDSLVIASDREVAAAAVGQQMAQLGIEVARRNLRVQPTVEVRKGYRLNVMVNKDVIFPGGYQP